MIRFFQRRRLQMLRRSPRIFVPVGSKQVVIPYRPISTLLTIFFATLSVFFFLRSDIFQVKALEFEFEQLADEALVRQRISEEVLARSIFFLDSKKVEEEIKVNFPTVKAVVIEKNLPDRLVIKIAVRQPLAIIEDKNQARFLIDQEGLLFRTAGEESLPVINLSDDFEGAVGTRLAIDEQGIAGYLETLDLMSQKGLETKAIYLRADTIEIRLAKTTVWLNAGREIEGQVGLMTEILRRLKLKGKTPKIIDLRFSRTVVKL
ncbi:MAG: FtsQ-type POTRA domain-containing protein [Patescibacteria group bacterium]